ncbi:CRISPR-associated endonuclease Cas2 [Campylobacter sp. RM15925]|uniref:CRISPR-associated endonuclease Cas2 n=1 Tax=Campylobacter sp. RM15925 TaxID=1705724 RepID=UPI001474C5CE|nr:CRISPR-associated endonuclease Cas2 [Campylobacter sp. RM15925]
MKFVIAYDIQNSKNRKKLSDILEGLGYRVNLSVFECEINEAKLKKLIRELTPLVNSKKDSLRFYRICETCVGKSFELCDHVDIFEAKDLFV